MRFVKYYDSLLVSLEQIVKRTIRKRYRKCLLVELRNPGEGTDSFVSLYFHKMGAKTVTIFERSFWSCLCVFFQGHYTDAQDRPCIEHSANRIF